MKRVTFSKIENQTEILIQRFLDGEDFSLELSDQVLNTFDRADQMKYSETLKEVKNMINLMKIDKFEVFFFIENNFDLTIKQLSMVVRYVNLCHKEKENIIVVNNEVVYMNPAYSKYEKKSLEEYVHRSMIAFKNKKKNLLFKKKVTNIKNSIFKFFSSFIISDQSLKKY